MRRHAPAGAVILGGMLTFLPAFAAGLESAPADLCPEDIIARMNQSEANRDRTLVEYSALRHYTLKGQNGRTAVMTARLSFNSQSGKTFEVLSKDGADGIFGRVFDKVIEAEAQTSRAKDGSGAISPENYDFRLLGVEERDGHRCYVIQLEPKRKTKYLLNGQAWIDADDFALVRVEGRTAGSVSFWIGKPYIVQCFEKVGNYWLASKNDSIANAKLIGRTELTIESSDYSVPGLQRAQVAERFTGTAN